MVSEFPKVPAFGQAHLLTAMAQRGDVSARPTLVAAPSEMAPAGATAGVSVGPDEGPGFGTVSPIVAGRQDARALANFIYLAVVAHELHDLVSIEYRLELSGEELVFLPAVWDPRYVLTSNWRFLLREFDDLVA